MVTDSFMNFDYDGLEKWGGIGERFDFNEFKDNEVKGFYLYPDSNCHISLFKVIEQMCLFCLLLAYIT